VADIVHHRMLPRERKPLFTHTGCLEDFAVPVKTFEGVLDCTEVILIDGWPTNQIAEVEEGGDHFDHVVGNIAFDGR
jgi:hypothetical protein